MPKLHPSKKIAGVLFKNGFIFVSQSGSHGKFRKLHDEKIFTVIVPMAKREIPIGTFHSMLRQSGLKKEDFD